MINNKNGDELRKLYSELEHAIETHQNLEDELSSFLSQYTCILDAPSCGCSEEELNDPLFERLYTEQSRLTNLSKTWGKRINELKELIVALEAGL